MHTENNNYNTTDASQPPPYHKPPPSYGFSNAAGFQSYDQSIPPPISSISVQSLSNPNVVYVQPQRMSAITVYGLPSGTAHINDYMAWSIFNIFCCGLVFGLIGAMLSSQVQQRKMAGDAVGAQSLSTATAIWNAFTTLAGIGIIIGICIYASNIGYF
ncbi:unnamed protein product [Rotaria magnacalcarata]|uniref:Interferon-induced transmembrane protein n=1 Tax=Rotaria magnacalcarata TaxID=392030 RepID=A0A816STR9_9BILA|nr:unnamed protein product [Rotaria magnacalcarata]CAF3834986.1 unnamed protein product [Rotaria magnacalcarata]